MSSHHLDLFGARHESPEQCSEDANAPELVFNQIGGRFSPKWRPISWPVSEANFSKVGGQFFLPNIGLHEVSHQSQKCQTVCKKGLPDCEANFSCQHVSRSGPIFGPIFFGPKNARIARDIPSEKIGQKIGLEIGPRWAGCQPRILGSILVCSEGAKCNGHTEPGDVSSSEREAPAIMAQSTNR